jgi:hypothetical protein
MPFRDMGSVARGHTGSMDMELAGRMLDVVAAIPPGRVATYGDVA